MMLVFSTILDVISRSTAATYVTACSNVDPSSHITFIPITASAGHQGSTDSGWYSSQEDTFVCVKITAL
jgi:hypothetical protein